MWTISIIVFQRGKDSFFSHWKHVRILCTFAAEKVLMFGKILNTFGTKMLVAVINLTIAILISQVLGDSGKGVQSLVLTNISFILIFSEIVCGASLVYLTSRHSFSKLWLPSILWALLMAVVMGLIINLLTPGLDCTLAVHTAILSFVSSFANIHFRVLIGKEEVKKANANTLLQPFMLLVTLVVYYLLLGKRDIYGYIIGLYVAYLSSSILGFFQLREEYRMLRLYSFGEYKESLKDLFKYGFLNQTGHFVQFFNLRLSYYLLNAYVDTAHVGVYSNSVSLAESIWIISNSIALVQYGRISNSTNKEYNQNLTLNLGKLCFVVSLAAVLVLALLPSSLYQFVFGPEFGGMAHIIRILAPGVLCYSLFLILGHYYSGSGRYFMNTLAALCGLVATLVGGFILVPRFATTGAAITASVAYALNAFFLLFCFLKESSFRPKDFVLTPSELKEYIVEIKNHYLK
jgi:O-antigen/teichoic acid export membrane protein